MNNNKRVAFWGVFTILAILLTIFIILRATMVVTWAWSAALIPLWFLIPIVAVGIIDYSSRTMEHVDRRHHH
jgi:hypothetical protein